MYGPQYQQQPYPPQGQPRYGQQPYPPQQYGQQNYQQPPYGQPPYNPGYQQPQSHHNPPPQHHGYHPKKRGSSVVTRYPPPQGYRGGHHHQGGPPHVHQGYQQGPPQQGYPPPQGYPPQQPGYGPPQGYPPHQGYPPAQEGYQQGYQGYQDPSGYPPQNYQQQYPPPQGYSPQGYQQGPPGPGGPYSDPSPQWQQPPYPSGPPASGPNDPYQGSPPPQQSPYNHSPDHSEHSGSMPPPPVPAPKQHKKPKTDNPEDQAWDFDYYGEPWTLDPDEINPDLSLGIIVWHGAVPATRALASTFVAAERDSIDEVIEAHRKSNKQLKFEEETVSKYFTSENAHEAFLSVKQTEYWKDVRDDPVFLEFAGKSDFLSLEEVVANRDRPSGQEDHDLGEAMELEEEEAEEAEEGEEGELRESSNPPKSEKNVMDNLEQALFSSDYSPPHTSNPRHKSSSAHATSNQTKGEDRRPLIPVRDEGQENLLAALGVSGSPKPVFPTPGPAYNPLEDSPDQTTSSDNMDLSNQQERSSSQNGAPKHEPGSHIPPPPPSDVYSPQYEPWNPESFPTGNGSRPSSAESQKSGGTMVGSDFHPDTNTDDNDNMIDVQPTLERTESGKSRKRPYDEGDLEADGKKRQHDDTTPRLRRKQPRVAAAYSRRW